MDDIVRIIITLAIAGISGSIFVKLKLPGGAMVGSLVGVIIFNLCVEAFFSTNIAYIPKSLRVFIQMFVGMRIGSKIKRKDILDLKKLVIPAVILVISMVTLNLFFGTLMSTIGGLDIATGLFACSPGGTSDMAIIADEMGADSLYVVALQLCRLLFIFLMIPPVLRLHLKKKNITADVNDERDEEMRLASPHPAAGANTVPEVKAKGHLTGKQKTIRFLTTVAVGCAAGYLFNRLGIKAGALVGAMVGVAVLNVLGNFAYFPKVLNPPLRFVSGAYVGQQMTLQSVVTLSMLGIPVLLMCLNVLVFSFIVPYIIHRFSKLDLATCMLASVPGGTQEMSMLAEDLGADVPKVTLLQTLRHVSVIMIFPALLSAISHLL